MLDKEMAQRLAARIMNQLGSNINIMNDQGIIIASGDASRVGSFHEVAFNIIRDRLETQIVTRDNNLIGVRPGVNMPIIHNDDYIGVIGITGDPEVVHHFASIVRLSVEIMLEFELYKEMGRQRQSTMDALATILLHEEPFRLERAQQLCEDLGLKTDVVRLPILIRLHGTESHKLAESLVLSSRHRPQDIVFPVWNDVVVFREVPAKGIKDFRSLAQEYSQSLSAKDMTAYTGALQDDLSMYRVAWRQLTWLRKHLGRDIRGLHHFNDFFLPWLQASLPFTAFESVFGVYAPLLHKMGEEVFIETAAALYQHNMNLNTASRHLHMHRNTMLFRLNKIRETLGIDPVNNASDRDLLFGLLHYIKGSQEK